MNLATQSDRSTRAAHLQAASIPSSVPSKPVTYETPHDGVVRLKADLGRLWSPWAGVVNLEVMTQRATDIPVMLVHPSGGFEMACWPALDMRVLIGAMVQYREQGLIPLDTVAVELPDGRTVSIA